MKVRGEEGGEEEEEGGRAESRGERRKGGFEG